MIMTISENSLSLFTLFSVIKRLKIIDLDDKFIPTKSEFSSVAGINTSRYV